MEEPGGLQSKGSQRVRHTTEGLSTHMHSCPQILDSNFRDKRFVRKNAWTSVQFSCSVVSDSLRPHGLQHTRPPCPSLSPRVCANSWYIELVSNLLVLSCPLLLPSVFPSIRVFSNESALPIRWPKYWNFSISPSNEYSGLISFRIHRFDLLTVQGTLKSLLQHHSSKASAL